MEQVDRERALIKFRNGTHQLLVATDLAARGIDVPEIKFIIHYHLPTRSEDFTHRNGRTARMHNQGTAYVLKWEEEDLPVFIQNTENEEILDAATPKPSEWRTLHISGGRRDKISKGDIIFFEEGPSGTHQLYNHSDEQFVYIDLRTKANIDVCEYPDSGKINILPTLDIFEKSSKVSYYTGEEDVRDKWPDELLRQD